MRRRMAALTALGSGYSSSMRLLATAEFVRFLTVVAVAFALPMLEASATICLCSPLTSSSGCSMTSSFQRKWGQSLSSWM